MADSCRVVAIDPICGLPITAADLLHDLAAIEAIIDHPGAEWCRETLIRRRAELEQLLEE